MFYLNEFFKIVKTNKLLSLTAFIGLFAVLTISHFESQIKDQLSIEGKVKDTPYFNALIRKDLNVDSVKRRMGNLPGVVNVLEGSGRDLSREVGHLKNMFGAQVVNNLAAVKYKKIKIELEKGVKVKSFSLIKEYLSRLVGKDSITIGQLKLPKTVKLKKDDPLYVFLKWIDSYAMIVFFGLWFIATFLLLNPILKRTFIIEKFQRKNYVGLKIVASGMGFFLVVGVVINYFIKNQINDLSMIFGLGMMTVALALCFVLRRSKKYTYGF